MTCGSDTVDLGKYCGQLTDNKYGVEWITPGSKNFFICRDEQKFNSLDIFGQHLLQNHFLTKLLFPSGQRPEAEA